MHIHCFVFYILSCHWPILLLCSKYLSNILSYTYQFPYIDSRYSMLYIDSGPYILPLSLKAVVVAFNPESRHSRVNHSLLVFEGCLCQQIFLRNACEEALDFATWFNGSGLLCGQEHIFWWGHLLILYILSWIRSSQYVDGWWPSYQEIVWPWSQDILDCRSLSWRS